MSPPSSTGAKSSGKCSGGCCWSASITTSKVGVSFCARSHGLLRPPVRARPYAQKPGNSRVACGAQAAAYVHGCTVRAAIIHDDELAIYRRVGHCGTEAFQKNGNVSCFVESRNYRGLASRSGESTHFRIPCPDTKLNSVKPQIFGCLLNINTLVVRESGTAVVGSDKNLSSSCCAVTVEIYLWLQASVLLMAFKPSNDGRVNRVGVTGRDQC